VAAVACCCSTALIISKACSARGAAFMQIEWDGIRESFQTWAPVLAGAVFGAGARCVCTCAEAITPRLLPRRSTNSQAHPQGCCCLFSANGRQGSGHQAYSKSFILFACRLVVLHRCARRQQGGAERQLSVHILDTRWALHSMLQWRHALSPSKQMQSGSVNEGWHLIGRHRGDRCAGADEPGAAGEPKLCRLLR